MKKCFFLITVLLDFLRSFPTDIKCAVVLLVGFEQD